MEEGTTPALDGLVVVDTSATLAGTVASSLLADFGAHVSLVEPPGGTAMRAQPAWPFWGRGKHSVVLDLERSEDRERLVDLGRSADVVIETWRPGVAAQLGFADGDLRPANPGLVYASITGFGAGHPWSRLKAYEPVVMAKTGGLSSFRGLTRREGPSFVSTPYCSFSAAHIALHGILAALIERERSGLGQRVETTMAQGLLAHDPWNWLLKVLLSRYDQAYSPAPPFDTERLAPNMAMMVRLMVGLSADGRWMQFSQTTDRLWAAFLRITGLTWTTEDPRLKDGPDSDDVEVRAEFWSLALEAVRSRSYDEWLKAFEDEPDVWAEIFRDGSELLHHPQLLADRRTTTIVDPDAGPVLQPGPIAVLDATPASVDRPAPALGEHDAPPARSEPAEGGGDLRGAEPLAGTTVIEFGTFFAAPYGATLLGELGARVIKVEQPGGDPIRHAMPFPDLGAIKVTAGKQSVALDVGTPDGHDIAMELVRRADVVLLAFRAGVASRLGIDPAALREVNPDLVILEAPGYGLGPPCGHRPAFAPTMGAGSGLACRNLGGAVSPESALELSRDDVKREAIRLSAAAMAVAQADGFSALAVASVMLLGLLVRERSGISQTMSTSMLTTMAHALSETMVERDVDHDDGRSAPRVDPDLLGLGPWYRLYACEEGWVFLAAPDPDDRSKLAEELALDLAGDDDRVAELLADRFAQQPAAVWEARLAAVDVTCAEVSERSPEETMMHGEAGRELGLVIDAHHPLLEQHPRLAPLVRFSRSATRVGPSPSCGADTDTVLEELGHDDARREQLRAAGVIVGG